MDVLCVYLHNLGVAGIACGRLETQNRVPALEAAVYPALLSALQ